MKKLQLVLSDPETRRKRIQLTYRVFDTPVAGKWAQELIRVSSAFGVRLPRRTYNFPGDPREKAQIAAELNRCIDIINSHCPGLIPDRAEAEMSQDTMNRLHTYFEIYRGPVLDPAEPYRSGPSELRNALDDFNIAVHRYENYCRNQRVIESGGHPRAHIILNWHGGLERLPLADEDYDHFTLRTVFGYAYLDYCDAGKQLVDVWLDGDDVVGDGNIRPQRYLSGDTVFEFSRTMTLEQTRAFEDRFLRWWDANAGRLSALNFVKGDKRNAIGRIPVAELCRDEGPIQGMSEDEIIAFLSGYQYIEGVNADSAATTRAPDHEREVSGPSRGLPV